MPLYKKWSLQLIVNVHDLKINRGRIVLVRAVQHIHNRATMALQIAHVNKIRSTKRKTDNDHKVFNRMKDGQGFLILLRRQKMNRRRIRSHFRPVSGRREEKEETSALHDDDVKIQRHSNGKQIGTVEGALSEHTRFWQRDIPPCCVNKRDINVEDLELKRSRQTLKKFPSNCHRLHSYVLHVRLINLIFEIFFKSLTDAFNEKSLL